MTALESIIHDHCELESVQAMLRYRHDPTYQHSERVVLLATAFADACALEEPSRTILFYGALFHDLGKVGIPDDILLHPGKLSNAQREVMHRHSTIGESIVRMMHLEHGDAIAVCVRHHHEHYNGGGYPDRLKGDAIPLLARMLTIIDGYDALKEDRPYRGPLSHDDAKRIMQNASGSVYDPRLLERFFSIEQLETIGEQA